MTTRACLVGALLLGSAFSAGVLACLGEDISAAPPEVGPTDAGAPPEAAGPSCFGQPFTGSRALRVEAPYELGNTLPPRPFGTRALVEMPPAPRSGDAGPTLLVGTWRADTATVTATSPVTTPGVPGIYGIAGLSGDTVVFARELTVLTSRLATARLEGTTLREIVDQPALNGDSESVFGPWVAGSPPRAVYFYRGDVLADESPFFRVAVSMQGEAPTFGSPQHVPISCTRPTRCAAPIATADETTLFYLASFRDADSSTGYRDETFEAPLSVGADVTTGRAIPHPELGPAILNWLSPDGCTAIIGSLNPGTWQVVTRTPR